jgi:ankyrin repeat protein
VKSLLAKGIHPDHPDYIYQVPLPIACRNGYKEIVNALLETGLVDVNAQNYKGRTPLYLALSGWHRDLVRPLLKAGADPNIKDDRGKTPYSKAEKNGDYVTLILHPCYF